MPACSRRFFVGGLAALPFMPALIAPAVIAVPGVAHAAASAVQLAASPIARLDLPWWRRRFEEKQTQLRQGAGLLWLGDSITQNWERNGPQPWAEYLPVWQRFYGHREAVDYGFIGDTTASLLWRIQHMDLSAARPRAAVMLIGANNFGRVHWPAEATVGGIAANIAELNRRLPATRVLLLSILPSDRGPWVIEQTEAANRALAARYGGGSGGVVYMDLTALFLRGGRIDTSKYYDPLLSPPEPALHPTASGMQSIAEAIEPTLARLMA